MAAIGLSIVACRNPSGIAGIRVVDDGEKINKEDISNARASDARNRLWKNNYVNIFGGRNEIVTFQGYR
jgi:hypothetical protein